MSQSYDLLKSQLQAQILLISEPTQIANDWIGVRCKESKTNQGKVNCMKVLKTYIRDLIRGPINRPNGK